MSQEAHLLRDLNAGHSALINVPLDVNIQEAADTMREWGRIHRRELSVVPMVTDKDQKLAVGPGVLIATSFQV